MIRTHIPSHIFEIFIGHAFTKDNSKGNTHSVCDQTLLIQQFRYKLSKFCKQTICKTICNWSKCWDNVFIIKRTTEK